MIMTTPVGPLAEFSPVPYKVRSRVDARRVTAPAL